MCLRYSNFIATEVFVACLIGSFSVNIRYSLLLSFDLSLLVDRSIEFRKGCYPSCILGPVIAQQVRDPAANGNIICFQGSSAPQVSTNLSASTFNSAVAPMRSG